AKFRQNVCVGLGAGVLQGLAAASLVRLQISGKRIGDRIGSLVRRQFARRLSRFALEEPACTLLRLGERENGNTVRVARVVGSPERLVVTLPIIVAKL